MIGEFEIKLSNGDKCFIRVIFNDKYKRLIIEDVDIIPSGKRIKQTYNFNHDNAFMKLTTFEERYQYTLNKFLEHPHLNKEHLSEALTKAWESLKPEAI